MKSDSTFWGVFCVTIRESYNFLNLFTNLYRFKNCVLHKSLRYWVKFVDNVWGLTRVRSC
jgi:hypothetical protein